MRQASLAQSYIRVILGWSSFVMAWRGGCATRARKRLPHLFSAFFQHKFVSDMDQHENPSFLQNFHEKHHVCPME